MKTHPNTPARHFEFCYPQRDTLLLVEDAGDEVVVRATRNTFTEEQKLAFVRQLAAEGFIAEAHRGRATAGAWPGPGVHWVIDYSWLELSEEVLARSRRFMVRAFVSASVLWILLMWAFLRRGGG